MQDAQNCKGHLGNKQSCWQPAEPGSGRRPVRAGRAGLKRALSAEVRSHRQSAFLLFPRRTSALSTLPPRWPHLVALNTISGLWLPCSPPSLAVWFVSRSSFIKGPEGALGEVSVTLETRDGTAHGATCPGGAVGSSSIGQETGRSEGSPEPELDLEPWLGFLWESLGRSKSPGRAGLKDSCGWWHRGSPGPWGFRAGE